MFTLLYHKNFQKSLKKIDQKIQLLIKKKLELLRLGLVQQLDIKPLIGFSDNKDVYWRMRVGSYRIIYKKIQEQYMILVLKLDARGDVYKK